MTTFLSFTSSYSNPIFVQFFFIFLNEQIMHNKWVKDQKSQVLCTMLRHCCEAVANGRLSIRWSPTSLRNDKWRNFLFRSVRPFTWRFQIYFFTLLMLNRNNRIDVRTQNDLNINYLQHFNYYFHAVYLRQLNHVIQWSAISVITDIRSMHIN